MLAAIVSIRTSHQNQPPDHAQVTMPAITKAIIIDPTKIAPRPAALASSVGMENGTALPPRQATMPYTGKAITPGRNKRSSDVSLINSHAITPTETTNGNVRQDSTARRIPSHNEAGPATGAARNTSEACHCCE